MTNRTSPRRPTPRTFGGAKFWAVYLSVIVLFGWYAIQAGMGSAFLRSFSHATGICLSCAHGDVDPRLHFVRAAVGAGDVSDELQSRAKTFGEQNDLQIQLQDGAFHYALFTGGQRLELFVTPASDDGLKTAQGKLADLVTSKQAELAKPPYRVSFAVENEVAEKQKSLNKDGTTSDTGTTILARAPRLAELYGAEAAIKRANPSYLASGDKTGVKFYFLKDSLYKEEKHYAYFTTDKDGKAAIYVTEGTTDGLWTSEEDVPQWAQTVRYGLKGSYFDTIESLLEHELAHGHQKRMGWDTDPEKRKQMTAATGFASFTDSKSAAVVYLIEVKGKNQTVDYYRLDSRSVPEKDKRWYRTDAAGNWLDQAGTVVDALEKAASLTNAQVRLQAVVPPSSNYFDTPDEIFAEAMKALRLGGDARQSLIAISPQLYRLVKDEDQRELNAAYGTFKIVENRTFVKGTDESAPTSVTRTEPVFMRGWDGIVVPYSQPAQDALAASEAKALQGAGN